MRVSTRSASFRWPVQVVVLERRLREVDVAVLDAGKRPERVAPVVPAVAEVEHHRDVVRRAPAGSRGCSRRARGRRRGRSKSGSTLTARKPSAERALAALRKASIIARRPPAPAGRRRSSRTARSPRGSRRRAAGRRAGRAACRRGRAGRRRRPRAHGCRARAGRGRWWPVELAPERRDLERVAAPQHAGETSAPAVDVVHLDELAHDGSRGIRLSDAGAPVLVDDPDDHGLPGAVEVELLRCGRAQDDASTLARASHAEAAFTAPQAGRRPAAARRPAPIRSRTRSAHGSRRSRRLRSP